MKQSCYIYIYIYFGIQLSKNGSTLDSQAQFYVYTYI